MRRRVAQVWGLCMSHCCTLQGAGGRQTPLPMVRAWRPGRAREAQTCRPCVCCNRSTAQQVSSRGCGRAVCPRPGQRVARQRGRPGRVPRVSGPRGAEEVPDVGRHSDERGAHPGAASALAVLLPRQVEAAARLACMCGFKDGSGMRMTQRLLRQCSAVATVAQASARVVIIPTLEHACGCAFA